jgi:hypothetical protein
MKGPWGQGHEAVGGAEDRAAQDRAVEDRAPEQAPEQAPETRRLASVAALAAVAVRRRG